MLQGSRIFGQLLSAAGLWLLMSPFVLFNQNHLSPGGSNEATLVSMAMGFMALLIAGLHERHYGWVRSVSGVALGIATVGGPWMLGYADQILALVNSSICGVLIASISVAQLWNSSRVFNPSRVLN